MKVGDGLTAWTNLPYFGESTGALVNAIDEKVLAFDTENKLTVFGFQEAEIGMTPIKGHDGQLIWTKLEAAELDSKIESLAKVVNQKVDMIYSEVDGEQIPWTLMSPEEKDKLANMDPRAQENVIEQICLANSGKCLAVVNKTVQLPLATGSIPGLVKLSKEISLNEEQALTVREVNVNKLVQTAGEEMHLTCGNSSL